MTFPERVSRKGRPIVTPIGMMALCLAVLASCDGLQSASDSVARAAFRAKFQQLPLVKPNPPEGRVLTMHIYEQEGAKASITANTVSFLAHVGVR